VVVGRECRRVRPVPCQPERHAACGRIVGVRCPANDNIERRGRIRHRAPVRSYGVLRVGNGDDACAASEADCRLDADHAVDVARTDDAAVRLGTERYRSEIGDTAAAEPELEPQALRSSEYGLWLNPPRPDQPAGGKEGAEVSPTQRGWFCRGSRRHSAQLCGDR